MGDCLHFSLRFNYDNPKHRKIMDVLDGLDKRQYASKTNFIITALEQYIEWLDLEEAGKKVRDSQRLKLGEVVTWSELNEAINSLKTELKAEMYEKFFQYNSVASYKVPPSPAENNKAVTPDKDNKSEESSSDIADDLSKYSGVMDTILSWSED